MSTHPPTMIQTLALTKRYPAAPSEKTVLREVSLSVPAGEFWIVSGPSGAGKTTLLSLLAGLIAPTSGQVRLNGKAITHLRDHHRALLRRHLVGMVFQEFALITGLTLWENLFLPLIPEGGPRPEHRRQADALLERFGLRALAHTPVERLSAGERQRAGILRALVADAPILLLDEPTASLDTENVQLIVDTLLALRGEGRTILATTHDPRLTGHPRLDGALHLVDGVLQQ